MFVQGEGNHTKRYRALLLLALLWMAPALACGSFVRPRKAIQPHETALTSKQETGGVAAYAIPTLTPTPTAPPPTATFTPTPAPGTALMIGHPARVVARSGLNVRAEPGTEASRVSRFPPGILVTVVDGPREADGFTWWKVQDRQGNVGWVAEGDNEDEWLTPRIGEIRPVNRPVRLGDRVTVTVRGGKLLSIRFQAGLDAVVARRVRAGTLLTVKGGPVDVDGYRWWQVVDDDGNEGWAAEGDKEERWLTPLE
ncbi:MAG TPA: hypothetical protein EYP04_00975 [Anaerolineae bacterium]|nr:hypothetical protein [Anaerolineae bacterium]HIQ05218.1 hypothetical protein [Anaerolineae bacterium]